MDYSPKQITEQLGKYIIGQDAAKRAVAVALRNRYRRSQLPDEVRSEITPKNIIMKGPTGVGKTEIARRLAKLVGAPFVKVEATKYTEVGYVGRDVESMVRDLVEVSIRLVKEEKQKEVEIKATEIVNQKLASYVTQVLKQQKTDTAESVLRAQAEHELKEGKLDNLIIEIDVVDVPKNITMGGPGMEGMEMGIDLGNIFGGMMPKKTKRRKVNVKQAREIFMNEECEKLIDKDALNTEAIMRAEQTGIIFIDEIDKIASRGGGGHGPEVSREGVQRDILPIVEGCTVQTKYGPIKTDYILFIAAGAFHISRMEDLIPELQGRFPIRVELTNLNKADFLKILTQPENAVTKQYTQLLKVDNINLVFEKDALGLIAEIAENENLTSENLGARRLHNIVEQLLEDISYNATGKHPMMDVKIDSAFVNKHLHKEMKKQDLRKYVL
ncbi:MAG: ATP-dependent protease ATPase subunit HslU [Firmicutes bacterium]|nr:ATP-dependent protease ATPase subunit HslU [Bacillota bacterium]